jgi:zinc transporter ZupT
LLGISLHKVTESLVFAALLVGSGVKLVRAIFLLILFALMAPLGAATHYFIVQSDMANVASLTPKVTGVLIGILLHVSTTIIFESEEGHKFNWIKFGAILLGIALAALVSH